MCNAVPIVPQPELICARSEDDASILQTRRYERDGNSIFDLCGWLWKSENSFRGAHLAMLID
jgi:hypothetical protein